MMELHDSADKFLFNSYCMGQLQIHVRDRERDLLMDTDMWAGKDKNFQWRQEELF